MKFSKILILCIPLILWTQFLLAKEPFHSDDWAIEVGVSRVVPRGEIDERYGATSAIDLTIDRTFSRYFGMSGSVQFQKFNREWNDRDINLDVWDFILDGVLQYPINEKWRPFINAGMGIYVWRTDAAFWNDGASDESLNLGFNFGYGISYLITDAIGFTARMSSHRLKFEDDDGYNRWMDYTIAARFLL